MLKLLRNHYYDSISHPISKLDERRLHECWRENVYGERFRAAFPEASALFRAFNGSNFSIKFLRHIWQYASGSDTSEQIPGIPEDVFLRSAIVLPSRGVQEGQSEQGGTEENELRAQPKPGGCCIIV